MTVRCAYCRTKLALGADVRAGHHGVLGPRGFVPLEKHVVVCSDACLAHYYEPVPDGPHRVP